LVFFFLRGCNMSSIILAKKKMKRPGMRAYTHDLLFPWARHIDPRKHICLIFFLFLFFSIKFKLLFFLFFSLILFGCYFINVYFSIV